MLLPFGSGKDTKMELPKRYFQAGMSCIASTGSFFLLNHCLSIFLRFILHPIFFPKIQEREDRGYKIPQRFISPRSCFILVRDEIVLPVETIQQH